MLQDVIIQNKCDILKKIIVKKWLRLKYSQ